MPYGLYLKLDNKVIANGDYSSDDKISGTIYTDPSLVGSTGETFLDTFRDYSSQTTADAAWTSTDTANHRVNLISNNLKFNIVFDSTNDSIAHDFTSIDNTNWVLRFKLRFDVLTASTNSSFWIGMSDTAQTTAASGNQDSLGMQIVFRSALKQYGGVSDNNTAWNTTTTDPITHTFLVDTDYYVEIIKTSSTTFTVEIFTSSDFSTGSLGKSNGVTAANVNSLRYLKIMNRDDISEAGQLTGSIDNVSFWDGVAIPPIDTRIKDLSGYTLTLRLTQWWGDTDFFNKEVDINIARRGTWVYDIKQNELPASGLYLAEIELAKSGTSVSTLNIQEVLVKNGASA